MSILERIFKTKLIAKLESQVDSALKRSNMLEAEIDRLNEFELKNRVLKLYVEDDEAIIELMDIVKKADRINADKQRGLDFPYIKYQQDELAQAQDAARRGQQAYNSGFRQGYSQDLLGLSSLYGMRH